MSVRVVARIRPLLKAELDRDSIVEAASSGSASSSSPNIVRIPNPKKATEDFSFQFNSVYDRHATQQDIFDGEVSPTIKHLFNGFDVTLFAYGVTGTGKTHTMRGGKTLAERGVIPRLLSGIFRRSRKIEKDSQGASTVQISMSYYEIYNDRVFDLFEAPEKRTPTGLQLRDNHGKTVVVGLTERPCTNLKEFEMLYDQANVNRSTSATKLNAHSSRSHAVLCVKVAITTGEETRTSIASAIDLAGSEDNRRTDNGKERLVESASINKSLFVLAQCVEAISKKQSRIPYRESKMTRILSLGQNNGLTIMILNLAPVKSYHLDTLSSLNFANRTKKIEIKEVENEPIFKGPPRAIASISGPSIQRQPLRALATSNNSTVNNDNTSNSEKPAKSFAVYSDRKAAKPAQNTRAEPLKRSFDNVQSSIGRPSKLVRPSDSSRIPGTREPNMSKATLEEMVEKKVEEILAARALNEPSKPAVPDISEQVQRRLELLEQKIENKEDTRAEGLTYLLMAKQHHVRGEDVSALKMYQLALPFFPDNEKLANKMHAIQEKLKAKREQQCTVTTNATTTATSIAASAAAPSQQPLSRASAPVPLPTGVALKIQAQPPKQTTRPKSHQPRPRSSNDASDEDDDFRAAASASESDSDADSDYHKPASKPTKYKHRKNSKAKRKSKSKLNVFRDSSTTDLPTAAPATTASSSIPAPTSSTNVFGSSECAPANTPRTSHLLSIINTRDVSRIRSLRGVGAKKAEIIVESLGMLLDDDDDDDDANRHKHARHHYEDEGDEMWDHDGGEDAGVRLDWHQDMAERRRREIRSLDQLAALKGVGVKAVEKMREGVLV
ncbi:MAG: hypothetical protein M1819_005758 [Sarea resinae]|nr:MAG: hypothetical protein M1819_005758 [Sarea resinae]